MLTREILPEESPRIKLATKRRDKAEPTLPQEVPSTYSGLKNKAQLMDLMRKYDVSPSADSDDDQRKEPLLPMVEQDDKVKNMPFIDVVKQLANGQIKLADVSANDKQLIDILMQYLKDENKASQPSMKEANDPKRKAADIKTAQATADAKDQTDIDLGKMFEPKVDQPIAKVEPPQGKTDEPKTAREPEIKKASAAKTAAAMRSMTPTDQMRDMLGRINVPDELIAQEPELPTDHAAVEPEPPPPSQVPAMISRAIAAHDPNMVNPEFHQVKNLPGYMSRAIRAMGRETFRQYTNTPIEDISVIAHMGGQGPNSEREITAVAQWLKSHARKIDQAEMDFGQTIPGYTARTAMYTMGGMRFLVVQDFAGGYIYAWPEGDATNELEGPDGDIKALMGRYGV